MEKLQIKTLVAGALLFPFLALLPAAVVQAVPVPVATYLFDGNFSAEEAGVDPLTPIDPLGLSHFETATISGESRTVWRFDGNRTGSPYGSQHAGLMFDSDPGSGRLIHGDTYSVEMVFEFDNSDWRRLIDTSNRQSNDGLYVDNNGAASGFGYINTSPTGLPSHPTRIYEDIFYRMIVTVGGTGANGDQTVVYMPGASQAFIWWQAAIIDFSPYAVSNPERLMHFFVDNFGGGFSGSTQFSDGSIALLRIWDEVLTDPEVNEVFSSPLPSQSEIPAPATIWLLLAGAALFPLMRRQSGHC